MKKRSHTNDLVTNCFGKASSVEVAPSAAFSIQVFALLVSHFPKATHLISICLLPNLGCVPSFTVSVASIGYASRFCVYAFTLRGDHSSWPPLCVPHPFLLLFMVGTSNVGCWRVLTRQQGYPLDSCDGTHHNAMRSNMEIGTRHRFWRLRGLCKDTGGMKWRK